MPTATAAMTEAATTTPTHARSWSAASMTEAWTLGRTEWVRKACISAETDTPTPDLRLDLWVVGHSLVPVSDTGRGCAGHRPVGRSAGQGSAEGRREDDVS